MGFHYACSAEEPVSVSPQVRPELCDLGRCPVTDVFWWRPILGFGSCISHILTVTASAWSCPVPQRPLEEQLLPTQYLALMASVMWSECPGLAVITSSREHHARGRCGGSPVCRRTWVVPLLGPRGQQPIDKPVAISFPVSSVCPGHPGPVPHLSLASRTVTEQELVNHIT